MHIVRGTVPKLSAHDSFELTHWALIKLPRQRQFLYRSYGAAARLTRTRPLAGSTADAARLRTALACGSGNMQWKRLTLSALSLDDASRTPGPIPIFVDGLGIKDVKPPPREAESR